VPALTITSPGETGSATGQELSRLAAHLQRTREQERAALARELHDELGAILTAARLDLAWLSAQPACAGDPTISARLQGLQRVLQQGIELKRRIIEDLHPTILTHLGLAAAVEHVVGEFRCRFDGTIEACIDPSVTASPEAGLALYRIAQESLTNAMKHADATRIEVVLERKGRHVVMRIEDNGRGFDPARVGACRHGLIGMRHRMLAVRGQVLVDAEPGGGTVVSARIPAPRRRDQPADGKVLDRGPTRQGQARARGLHLPGAARAASDQP
jgi:signal transduction histidine kinase